MKKRFSLFDIVILSGIFLFASCSHSSDKTDKTFRNVILVDVETTGDSIRSNYYGVVEEGKSVNAAFMTGGKLMHLNVSEGDRIRKGQLLASLDDTDYLIGVSQLQVQYDQMVAEKKRMDEMFARHNIAPNDYEKFSAGFEQLRLQLEMARNKLGYTKLYSPSDGFVSFKYMQPGELVDAGTPVYKITDDSRLEVAVDLPLAVYLDRNSIKNVYGKSIGIDEIIPLKIESFTPDADNNQLYHMKLDIPAAKSGKFTPGMNISVFIERENNGDGESLIPSRSIFEENGSTFVWVFNESDSVLSKKPVSVTGQPQGDRSKVKGLSGGEKIVAAGVKQLKEGEKVNVVTNPVK